MRQHIGWIIITIGLISQAFAQPAWETKLSGKALQPELSSNGKFLLYLSERDSLTAVCISLADGKEAWHRSLAKIKKECRPICRFVGNDRVLLPIGNNFELVRTADGTTEKALHIVGDSWQDCLWEDPLSAQFGVSFESLHPTFWQDVAVFFFDKGFQVINLQDLSLVWQSPAHIGYAAFETWELNLIMVTKNSGIFGDIDSLYCFDLSQRKMIYHDKIKHSDLNNSLYQHFFIEDNRLYVLGEDSIRRIDLDNPSRSGTIPIDPDDPDSYLPIVLDGEHCIMVSIDGQQQCYSCLTGLVKWSTPKDTLPGMIDQVLPLPDHQAIVFTFANDLMSLARINTESGVILWKKNIFRQDGKYFPGHKRGSIGLAILMSVVKAVAVRMATAGAYTWRSNPTQDIQRNKSSRGYFRGIAQRGDTLDLVTQGKIYAAWADLPREHYNGEALVSIDLRTGNIVRANQFNLIAGEDEDKLSATDMRLIGTPTQAIAYGPHDIYVIDDGFSQNFNFGKEKIAVKAFDEHSLFVVSDNGDDRLNCWKIDLVSRPHTQTLIARAERDVFNADINQLSNSHFLNVTSDSIIAYPLRSGDAMTPPSGKQEWAFAFDDLDIGKLRELHMCHGDVELVGRRQIAHISSDGKCKWVKKWYASESEDTRLPVTEIGNVICYAVDRETRVISRDCAGRVIGDLSPSLRDLFTAVTSNGDALIVIVDDEAIRCFKLN